MHLCRDLRHVNCGPLHVSGARSSSTLRAGRQVSQPEQVLAKPGQPLKLRSAPRAPPPRTRQRCSLLLAPSALPAMPLRGPLPPSRTGLPLASPFSRRSLLGLEWEAPGDAAPGDAAPSLSAKCRYFLPLGTWGGGRSARRRCGSEREPACDANLHTAPTQRGSSPLVVRSPTRFIPPSRPCALPAKPCPTLPWPGLVRPCRACPSLSFSLQTPLSSA